MSTFYVILHPESSFANRILTMADLMNAFHAC